MIYWLTGQSGSGKTTIAKEMCKIGRIGLYSNWFNIDGDYIRNLFNNKDYSELGRRKNVEIAQQIAQYLHIQGKEVVVSLVSPYKDQRDNFKQKMGDDLKEIYLHTNEIRGKENFFVEDYEPPTENYLYICTDNITVKECVEKILKEI